MDVRIEDVVDKVPFTVEETMLADDPIYLGEAVPEVVTLAESPVDPALPDGIVPFGPPPDGKVPFPPEAPPPPTLPPLETACPPSLANSAAGDAVYVAV